MTDMGRILPDPYVKVPEEMYRQIERRAMRATELEEAMLQANDVLKKYKVIGVMTLPPTGDDAPKVFQAVETLIQIAQGVK
jgi:uncharacterized pyridoxal phosphate-containing UPF0001 family protein